MLCKSRSQCLQVQWKRTVPQSVLLKIESAASVFLGILRNASDQFSYRTPGEWFYLCLGEMLTKVAAQRVLQENVILENSINFHGYIFS